MGIQFGVFDTYVCPSTIEASASRQTFQAAGIFTDARRAARCAFAVCDAREQPHVSARCYVQSAVERVSLFHFA